MARTYNRLEIDVNKKPTDIITAVQADNNSRYLDVSLFNNGVPLDLTGHEVKIFMVKPENGGEIWNDGVITDATAGRCEFLMTTEALARMGHLQTQISIWKDNTEILSTQVFEINVTKTLLGNSSVESSNEYGTLVVLFQNLYEAYALMTDMVSSFGKKGAVADARNIVTFWQGVEYLAKYMDTDLKGLLEKAIANSSVQGVLDLLGNTGDTGNSTVMGKLRDIYDSTVFSTEAKVVSGILPKGTETTVLSVFGKGALHSFGQGRDYGTSPSTIKIIVDGKILVNGEMTNKDSGYAAAVYVGNPADVNFAASGSSTRSGFVCPFFYVSDKYYEWVATINGQELSATKWTFQRGVQYIPLVSPIVFETSLKIICTGSDTMNDKYGCLYELR